MWYKQGHYLGNKLELEKILDITNNGIKISEREKEKTLDDYGKQCAWEILQKIKKENK